MRSFVIDSLPESVAAYRNRYTIVAVDVIRATTTAVTALAVGHRVFPVATTEEAKLLASEMPDALLVGEQGGVIPEGFDLTNSPFQLTRMCAEPRSIVLVSSSGTRLMCYAVGLTPVYVGCFMNLSALSNHLVDSHQTIAVIGAGSRMDFRKEDKMGCAYIGKKLIEAGYKPENSSTSEIVSAWSEVDYREIAYGRSAEYLKRSGQTQDLDFILDHFDDLDIVPIMKGNELVPFVKPQKRLSFEDNTDFSVRLVS